MTVKLTKVFTAFSGIGTAVGLVSDVVGFLAPDPLELKLDTLQNGLSDLKDELGAVEGRLTNIIASGFAGEVNRDISNALAAVENAESAYRTHFTQENRDVSQDEGLALDVYGAVNTLLAQFTGFASSISLDDASTMINAINYGVSLTLAVSSDLDSGAIGRDEVSGIFTDAAAALDLIAPRFETYLLSTAPTEESYTAEFTPITRWTQADLRKNLPDLGQNFDLIDGAIRNSLNRLDPNRSYTDAELDAILEPGLVGFGATAKLIWEERIRPYRDTQVATIELEMTNTETGTTRTTEWDVDVSFFELFTLTNGQFGPNGGDASAIPAGLVPIFTKVLLRNDVYRGDLEATGVTELSETSAALRELAIGEDRVGNAGDNAINGTDGYDRLRGLAGDDTVMAGGNDDVAEGGSGNDRLHGEDGADVLHGEVGNDQAYGGLGDDVLFGGNGADRLDGGEGSDQLLGGAGADYLNGGAGADRMSGGLGNDFYIVGSIGDEIEGEIAYSQGGGIDTVRTWVNNYVQPDNIELVRITNITGTLNHNATGNDAPGTLVGNAGNNILTGRGGNDQINGNAGNDRLIGNTGRDTLVGGEGADTFVFTSLSDSRAGAAARDVINGFERGADKIDLSAIDANLGFAGEGAFDLIGTARFDGDGAASAGQLRLQQLGGPNAVLVEGDLRGDGIADFQVFVNLTTVLNAGDFIL